MNTYNAAKMPIRFWNKVSKADDCWNWIGARTETHGVFWVKDRQELAHRQVWLMTYGSLPPSNQVIMHKCDNGFCVNPLHLQAGTFSDNTQDMLRKGRGMAGRIYNNVISIEDVRSIRLLLKYGHTTPEIAENFPISRQSINDIHAGRTWINKE